jgi:hypothetical protein
MSSQPPTLFSTISHLFLPPCLRSDDDTAPQIPKRRKSIVCNQYQRGLYLRPIMPPTTRRQSRTVERGEVPASARVDGDVRRESLNVEIVEVEQSQSGERVGVGVEEVEEGDAKMEHVDLELRDEGERKGVKSRTMSMEIHEAIDALHRSDDDDDDRKISPIPTYHLLHLKV